MSRLNHVHKYLDNKTEHERLVDGLKSRAYNHLYNTRNRAKKKGIKCTLDYMWLRDKLKTGKCELTGMAFEVRDKKGYHPFASSIDRIDNSKGYHKNNCRVILNCVNSFKGTLTDDQVLEVTEKLYLGLAQHLED